MTWLTEIIAIKKLSLSSLEKTIDLFDKVTMIDYKRLSQNQKYENEDEQTL